MLLKSRPGKVGGQADGGGGYVLLHTQTISGAVANVDVASTDLDWTKYGIYEIEYINIAVDTDDVEMRCRVYDTTLAAWQADANDYKSGGIGKDPGGIGAFGTLTGTYIELTYTAGAADGIGNAANEVWGGTVRIIAPADGYSTFFWHCSHDDATATPNMNLTYGRGKYIGSGNAISGFRIFPSAGNIDGGKVVVWGVRTA